MSGGHCRLIQPQHLAQVLAVILICMWLQQRLSPDVVMLVVSLALVLRTVPWQQKPAELPATTAGAT